MNTGWNLGRYALASGVIINLLGNEYWLELNCFARHRMGQL